MTGRSETISTNTSPLSSKSETTATAQITMKKPRIRRYSIHSAKGGTARVAFEITTLLLGGSLKPEILRENQNGHCFRSGLDSFLAPDCVSATLVMIVHVSQRDIIIIRFYNESGILVHQDRIRISKSFIPELVEFKKYPKSGKVVSTQRHDFPAETGTLVHMHPDELKKLFCDHHPKWLRSRLDAVLDSWELEIPMSFVRVAPRARISRNLPLLIQHEPRRALSEFLRRLDQNQLQHCIQQEPFAAVIHAFVRIPRNVRTGLVRKFSTYVLEHHLERLTERELVSVSSADAKTAFPLRHFVEGRRHAIMLANSYPASFFLLGHTSGPDFQAEVKDSVLEHPLIWWNSHHQSFAILFRALASTLGVEFTGKELHALVQKLGPGLRTEFRRFIASSI